MSQEYKDLAKLIKQINKNIEKHEEQQKSLPPGTIFVRKINNKSYVYRNKKLNGKTNCKYLGCLNDPEVQKAMEDAKQYKKNALKIKQLKKNLDKICKKVNSKSKNENTLTKFAININKVDGISPDKDAVTILGLYEKGILELEEAEKALMRLSYAHR